MADINLYSNRLHPRRMFPISSWIEGLSDFNKVGGSFLWARGVDYRTDPSQLTLLPQSILEAGQSVFSDLTKWAEQVVGRTVTLGQTATPITNNSFESSQNNVVVYRGFAASGLEFAPNFVGTLGTNYSNSSQNTYNYFAQKKFSTVRLPFTWERAQQTLLGGLDATYMGVIDAEIAKAASAGLKVILDLHNYGRRLINLDGGVTESFTSSLPKLLYPYADYSQGGNIVLRNYGEALLGTVNNPISPATGYHVTFNMKFNSRDDSFGGEGLYIRPMWTADNNCYEFGADIADNTWTLKKIIGGVSTTLASGAKTWGTSSTYAISIDVNQATNGFINVSINGTPLFTTNSIATDAALAKGQVAFYPAGVHVQIDTLVLNINGDTSTGGLTQYIVGSTQVPNSYLADLWTRIATRYANDPTVLGYDIMNEPHDMLVPTTTSNYKTTSSTTLMMQAAINAIRAVDINHYIIAELDHWAGGQNFTTDYGANPDPWLTDSANKLVYSFHYYFDNDHSGTYAQSFASTNNTNISGDVTPIMSWAQTKGVYLHCGEYGVPNISAWQVCLTTFFGLLNTYNVWANHWAAGDGYTAVTVLQPTGSVGSYVDQLQMAIVGLIANLVPAATTASGWTLGSDFFFLPGNAYDGNWSVKQTSTGGNATLTTASGSGIAVTAYADYQLNFYSKVSVTAGQPASLQILGGSLSGPNLLATALSIPDTAGQWVPVKATFNAGQYTSVFIVITNQAGDVVAYYDLFTMTQINSLTTFEYGEKGGFYKRYSNGAYAVLGSIPNSHGNGMAYYGEDDYLYIMGDKTVGRYGPISAGTPALITDYLTAAGGVPTNTNSILLAAASSQYMVKTTPAAALQITGDIAIEAWVKPTSLPAVGSSMTIASLWTETGNARGWKLDIFGVSGYFGDGSDGSLTIASNTTDSPIDSACSGTSGTTQLSANNASFAIGQRIIIVQMMGTAAGTWQETTIQGYDSVNHIITTQDPLAISYNSSFPNAAQVYVRKQYSSITLNAGITWTVKPFNGVTGGILAPLCNGTVTINGTITSTAGGFRGGAGIYGSGIAQGYAGEGSGGASVQQNGANGNGGGGGLATTTGGSSYPGGGGGYGASGATGTGGISSGAYGAGGNSAGTTDLTTLLMGGGGGGGGASDPHTQPVAAGGNGGGIIFLTGVTLAGTGTLVSNGANGGSVGDKAAAGGGGAGGAIFLKAQVANLGSLTVTATPGSGGSSISGVGGTGAVGRVHIDYLTSYTLTATPAVNATQDSMLVTSVSYQARLGISNDGTSFEYLTQNLANLAVGQFDHIQVSWASATSTASFFEGGVPIGTSVGTKTAINATAADFAVGANKVTAYQNFFDGEINDVRIWNTQRTQAQFAANNLINLGGVAAGLVGNWFLTNTPNDLTTNSDNLVPTNSPVYVTDVPYPGATTRLDIDQTGGGTGQTYTLPTVLTENQSKTFVPAQDPQKSLQINIGAKGTGNWTLVVHDGLNRVVATVTVANASLPSTGLYEFLYPQTFSPVIGATYHFHLYSSVNDGTVKTTTVSDITTIQFTTYYQFLLNDTEYHPAMQMGNSLAIGNGRYLAVLNAAGGDGQPGFNAAGYKATRLRFPAGWRVRCLAKWRGYYAIGCWKGTNIKDFDQGIVFLWDGFSVTYNDFFDVPEGGINAMYGENGTLYISAGYKGDLLEYTGADSAIKVKRIPRVGKGKYVEIAPGGMTYWQGLLRIAVAFNSDSATLERGVYTWGTYNKQYDKSLSFDYPISTGNRSSSVRIGALVPVGGNLLVGWEDNISHGMDAVNISNPPQTTGTIEELITDMGIYWKEKQALTVRADHFALKTGENVDVKYKADYEDSWHNLGIASQEVGDKFTRLPLPEPNAQYHALQIGLDLYAANGTSPTILEHSQQTDIMPDMDENGA